MPGPSASRKRRGTRGSCSYCGKVHKKGRRGDSCRGHGIRVDALRKKLTKSNVV